MKVRLSMVIAVLCMTATLLLAVAASAAISRLDLGSEAQLGPEGASVMIPVTFQCDVSDGLICIDAQVTQTRGNRIANGSGSAQASCTFGPQTVLIEVQSFTGVPYRQGRAVARAFAQTLSGSTSSDGREEIRIAS